MARALKLWGFILAGSLILGHFSICQSQEHALAIFNLRPTNFEAMGYNGEILYALVSVLEQQKEIALMPRRKMEEILMQQGIVQSDDPQAVSEAGKLLGIKFILFGHVTKQGAQILSHLQLMDIRQGQVIGTWDTIYSGREDILAKIPAFAKELTRNILHQRSRVPDRTVQAAQPDVHIENLMAYSEGEKVVLRWGFNPAEPIVGFNAYRAEHEDGPYQFIGKTNKNIFEDSKIRKGRTYFYRIGIIHTSGQEIKSPLTAEIQNIGEKMPHPPLIMEAKGFVRRVEIRFVPSLLNDKEDFKIRIYRIYRKGGTEKNWTPVKEVAAEKTSSSKLAFRIEDREGLDDGQMYTYTITSIDRDGKESPRSDPVQLITITRPVLRLEKENLLRMIVVAWEPVADIEGYYLYRQPVEAADWVQVAKIREKSKQEFEDEKDLTDGTAYRYRLSAYDDKGETGLSNTIEAKTKDLPPFPQGVQAKSRMVKSVLLSWEPIDDPDIGGYAVYRGLDPQKLEQIEKVKGFESDSLLDKGTSLSPLEDGREYVYALTSFNLFGAEGEISPIVRARTKPRPVAVAGFKLTTDPEAIILAWSPNPEPDIEAYLIYRRRNNGFWSRIEALGPDQTRYQDRDLKAASTYCYRIVVQDRDGLQSDVLESGAIDSPLTE